VRARRAHGHQRPRDEDRRNGRADELARRAQSMAIRRGVLRRSGESGGFGARELARALRRRRTRMAPRRRPRVADEGIRRARAIRRRRSRRIDARLRARGRAQRVLAAALAPVVVDGARRSGRSDRRRSQRHSVRAPVPHRRRHDRSRLRIPKPRPARGQRCPARALLHGDERRGDALDQRFARHRDLRRCRQRIRRDRGFQACRRLRRRRAAAHTDRTLPARRRVWRTIAAGAIALFGRSRVLKSRMTSESQDAAARKPSHRRGVLIALGVVALLGVAIVAVIGFTLSEHGLPFVVDRIVARSGGRVSVEGPSGSIAGTMRFRRITWHGADATLVADDVVVDWNPGTLLHKHLSIRGLGARHVDLSIKPSAEGEPTTPPTDLSLPLQVDIGRLDVGRLDWHAGPRSGGIEGFELGYSGDANAHHLRDVALVSEYGALHGDLDIGARAPLPVSGHVTLAGDGKLAGANASITLEGPLARLNVAMRGTYRDAAMSLQAVATPFATTPFASATGELTGVDASTFDASLPATRA